jgi:pilus assembly protein CpaB
VSVLVVTAPVEAGTPAEDLGDAVATEEVPAKVRAEGAIVDLDAVEGMVTTVDLVPGEQLVTERFGEAALRTGVPAGMHEVTIRLAPERALGGNIKPGDKVAVLASFEPFEMETVTFTGKVDPEGPKKSPNETHILLHKVQVTNVQVDATAGTAKADDDDDSTPETAPSGTLLVTLAVDSDAVQRVVFSAEYGTIWLSAEPQDAPETDLPIIDRGSVYR